MPPRAGSTIGEILDSAFGVYRRHLPVLVATASVVLLPGVLLGRLASRGLMELSALFALLAAVVSTAQASDALLGGVPTFLGGLRVGVRRFVPACLTMLFVGILGGVATLPFVGLLILGQPRVSGFSPMTYGLAAIVLAVLWMVVIARLLVRYFAVIPVAVLEPGGAPPDRSEFLARGNYGKIAIVLVIGALIYVLPGVVLAGAHGVVLGLRERGYAPVWIVMVVGGFEWVVQSFVTAFSSTLTTVLYYERRASKDRFAVEHAGPQAAAASIPTFDDAA